MSLYTTGRMGNIIFNDIPCLLSKLNYPKQKTPCTVKAIQGLIEVNHETDHIFNRNWDLIQGY